MFVEIYKTQNHKVIKFLGIKLKFKLPIRNIEKRDFSNKIIIHKIDGNIVETGEVSGMDIKFLSKNSVVEVYEPFNFLNCNIYVGENSKVIIQSSIYPISNLAICLNSKNSSVTIGKNCSIQGVTIEMNRVVDIHTLIGDNCMLSSDIELRAHDSHTLYDIETKKTLNIPKTGITIGNNVWIAQYVKILKGVSIAPNSVVGLGSIVTKSFNEQNIAIGGNPAKIIKRGVNWHRYNEYMYQERLEQGLRPYDDNNQELIKEELEKRFSK